MGPVKEATPRRSVKRKRLRAFDSKILNDGGRETWKGKCADLRRPMRQIHLQERCGDKKTPLEVRWVVIVYIMVRI